MWELPLLRFNCKPSKEKRRTYCHQCRGTLLYESGRTAAFERRFLKDCRLHFWLPARGEYVASLFHSCLTSDQIEVLERLQKMTFKVIYGFKIPYSECLQWAGIPTLWVGDSSFLNHLQESLTSWCTLEKDGLGRKKDASTNLGKKIPW